MFRILVAKIQCLRSFSGVAFAALLCATPFSTAYAWDRSPGGEPRGSLGESGNSTYDVAVGPCQDEDPIKDAELYGAYADVILNSLRSWRNKLVEEKDAQLKSIREKLDGAISDIEATKTTAKSDLDAAKRFLRKHLDDLKTVGGAGAVTSAAAELYYGSFCGPGAIAKSLSRLNKFLDAKTLERITKILDTYQKTKHAVDGAELWSEVQEALEQP